MSFTSPDLVTPFLTEPVPTKTTRATASSKRIKPRTGVGRAQNRTQDVAKQQNLLKYYNTKVAPIDLANQRFRWSCLSRQMQQVLNIGNFIEQMEWQELYESAYMQGNTTLKSAARDHLKITHGDVIRCDVFWSHRWQRLWDMRVWDPDRTLTAGDNEYALPLFDDLYLLSKSEDDFYFKNLRCHEIFIAICQQYKIPVGKVAQGTYRIPTFDHKGISPVDAIILAYKEERGHTGRRFIMRWINGKINVLPLVRNPILYQMRDLLLNATLHHVTPDDFATALTFRATTTDKHGKQLNKDEITVQHNVASYGYIHRNGDAKTGKNQHQLRQAAILDLSKRQDIEHTIDFQHVGIAVVRKGDALQILIPEEGYSGKKGIAWVKEITHTIQAGTYQMAPTMTVSDPIAPINVAVASKNKHQRAVKRTKRAAGKP